MSAPRKAVAAWKTAAAAFLTFTLLTTAAPAQRAVEPLPLTPDRAQRLNQGLTEILARRTSPSLSIAVVEGNRVVLTRAMGVADVTRGTAATPSTRYLAGSVSKIFTAVAVMMQVEQKRIDLDAPLSRYLPWAAHASEVTVRQAMMHRSGYPDYLTPAIANGAVAGRTTPRQIIDRWAKRPLSFPPGSAYAYSNTNYVLLGLTVEAVTHTSLDAWLRIHVLEPCHMTTTTFGLPREAASVAMGYGPAQSTVAPPLQSPGDLSWYYGCGDLVSTPTDLARFDIALMQGRLVAPATLRLMIDAAKPTGEGPGQTCGLGLQCLPLLGSRTLVGHHGGLPGFEADDEMIPADGFALVVMGNDFAFMTAPVLQLALQTFYPGLVATLEARQASTPPAKAPPGIDARVHALLDQIAEGRLDGALLTPALRAAMTPQTVSALATKLRPLGPLQALDYRGTDRIDTHVRYHYRVKFAHEAVDLTFVYDATGLLAGLFFQ